MFKRVIWMGVGFGAGVGATVWTEVKLRRTAQRFTPASIGDEVADRLQSLRLEVRDALRDGRQAMTLREAQLRGDLQPGQPRAQVIELPSGGARRHARTPEHRHGPAVPWSDHGHERPSARLS